MTYTQQEVEFMIASAIMKTEHLERERCEVIVRDLAVLIASPSPAFERAIERIRTGE